MAKILEFPSQQMQGLSFLENQLREMLGARGADEELMEFAAKTVREIYERYSSAENYSFSLELPAELSDASAENLRRDIEQAVEQVRGENHTLIIRLIAELALAEVKRFQLERG